MLAASLIQLTAVPFVILARRWALWIALISALAHVAAAVRSWPTRWRWEWPCSSST
jgi:hypothetical protein